MKKINISKFVEKKSNLYSDDLDIQIKKVEELVESKIISVKFANAIINYLIKKEVANLIKSNLDHILHNHDKKDLWLALSYSRKHTNYI